MYLYVQCTTSARMLITPPTPTPHPHTKALAALSRALLLEPDNLEALLSMGVSHTNELDLTHAVHFLHQWLKKHPVHGAVVPAEEAADASQTLSHVLVLFGKVGGGGGGGWVGGEEEGGVLCVACMCCVCCCLVLCCSVLPVLCMTHSMYTHTHTHTHTTQYTTTTTTTPHLHTGCTGKPTGCGCTLCPGCPTQPPPQLRRCSHCLSFCIVTAPQRLQPVEQTWCDIGQWEQEWRGIDCVSTGIGCQAQLHAGMDKYGDCVCQFGEIWGICTVWEDAWGVHDCIMCDGGVSSMLLVSWCMFIIMSTVQHGCHPLPPPPPPSQRIGITCGH